MILPRPHEVLKKVKVIRPENVYEDVKVQQPVTRNRTVKVTRPVVKRKTVRVERPVPFTTAVNITVPEIREGKMEIQVPVTEEKAVEYKEPVTVICKGVPTVYRRIVCSFMSSSTFIANVQLLNVSVQFLHAVKTVSGRLNRCTCCTARHGCH